MFTAETISKDFRGGEFQIVVKYANGADVFTKAHNVSSEDDMNRQIEIQLNKLNNLLDLEAKLTLGVWVKPIAPTVDYTPLQVAEAKLFELKRLVDLGVMKETDQEFVDAVSAYKTASAA